MRSGVETTKKHVDDCKRLHKKAGGSNDALGLGWFLSPG